MATPKISIVVPVYNTEKYLRQCIDSLTSQTLEDIEIIIVDDGSKEECARLCDELGISRGLMTDLKMGRKKSINAETAQKIASYLGVSVSHLLGQQDPSGVDILEQVDVAFYGDFKELNDEEKEAVRDMVRLMRQRRQNP